MNIPRCQLTLKGCLHCREMWEHWAEAKPYCGWKRYCASRWYITSQINTRSDLGPQWVPLMLFNVIMLCYNVDSVYVWNQSRPHYQPPGLPITPANRITGSIRKDDSHPLHNEVKGDILWKQHFSWEKVCTWFFEWDMHFWKYPAYSYQTSESVSSKGAQLNITSHLVF